MHSARGAALILFGFFAISLMTLSFPFADSVRGVVTTDAAPVAGAIVRWQGSTLSVRTDSRGHFTLAGPRRSRPLTAAKEGLLIATGSPPHLRLLPVPDDDNDDY